MPLLRTKDKIVVGVDIEAASIAACEVKANGANAEVTNATVVPLAPGLFREGEVIDSDGLAEALRALFAEHKLAKQVRLGLANQRIVVRSLIVPEIPDRKELDAAIRFKAQEQIPMPLDQAVLDYQIVEQLTDESGAQQTLAVAVAARRDMVSKVMQAVGKAGLKPIGIDLSAFAMIRALAGATATAAEPLTPMDKAAAAEAAHEQRLTQQAVAEDLAGGEGAVEGAEAGAAPEAPPAAGAPESPQIPARLYCNIGDISNLAVASGSSCLFTRVSTYGVEGMAQRLAERRQLSLEHARQWLVHVGLQQAVEELEGDPDTLAETRETLEEGAAKLVEELRLSLEFYASQEGARPVAGVTVCGSGTTIPGLSERLEAGLGLPFMLGRPAALAGFDDAEAARLTLSYGLALEE